MVVMVFADLPEKIDTYVKNKSWYWYLPLWFFGLYIFLNLLHFDPNEQPALPILLAQSFDFLLHELAHIATAFLPAILTAASGSLSELLLGLFLIYMAFRNRAYFIALICALWFMLACQSVGIYMADAVPKRLALVSLGGAISGTDRVIHDWNFVFGKLHLLGASVFIGDAVRVTGVVVGLAALGFTAWLMYKMAAAKAEKSKPAVITEDTHPTFTAAPPNMDPLAFQGQHKPVYPVPKRGPMIGRQPVQTAKRTPRTTIQKRDG